MFGDLSGIFDMFESFSKDLFSASLEEAKASAKAAQAQVVKLQKQQRAIEKLVANYRATMAKQAKAAKKQQEAWNKAARKRAKDAIPGLYGGPPLVTAPMAPDRRRA